MKKVGIGVVAAGIALAVPIAVATPSHAAAPPPTTKCLYTETSTGWAAVEHAPRGTAIVEYTMRTGTPGAYSAVTRTTTLKQRQWRVETGSGESFINWIKYYDSSYQLMDAVNVNTRCIGTPLDWPQ